MEFELIQTLRLYTVLISGLVRGGLAAATADALAHGGAGCIIFTGRSQPELQPVIDHINRKHPKTKIIFITADGANLATMRVAANTIKNLTMSIDGILCFPTVMAADWELTPDGVESHFQKNYLCDFLLVNSLLETMPAGSRVVLITTSVHQEAPTPKWEDVNFSVSLFRMVGTNIAEEYDVSRMVKPIIRSKRIRSQCLQMCCSSSPLPSHAVIDPSSLFLPIRGVSLVKHSIFGQLLTAQ